MDMARVSIRGTRPILFHAFTPDAISGGSGGRKTRTGAAGNDPEEWKKTYRATKDGQLYLTPEQICGVCREAARYTKRGRGSIQKMVAATLQVMDDKILLNRSMPAEITQDPEQNVYIDVRGVVNPATRCRNVRYRVATNHGWETSFSIAYDPTVVSANEMKSVLIDAGKLCGLGDGRSIGYGRFSIVSFDVLEQTG